MDQREELVRLMLQPGANKSELCRRFGVHRSNGEKWLARYLAEGREGLRDRSRRPKTSPERTAAELEAAVLAVREASNGAWGGRKIAWTLKRQGLVAPAASTISDILRRHGRLAAGVDEHPGPFQRFERAQPNELWQMDFKGHFAMSQGRCHPLTVLDDHARYALGLEACADEQDVTVRARLTQIFRRYGLPAAMLMDNGSPWGDAADQPFTAFAIWLMRLGVRVTHGAPYHPQTQGKDERFHRTLKAEVLQGASFVDLDHCQRAFDAWRGRYNHERPHEALAMGVPAERYRLSQRAFPEALAPIEYGPGDLVRKVDRNGFISFENRRIRIGKPFRGLPVALRQSRQDDLFELRFCSLALGQINLHEATFTRATCGHVDDAGASPTSPQALQPQPLDQGQSQ